MKLQILLIAFLIALIPVAKAQEKILDIQDITTQNGLTAWLVEDHSLPIITIHFGFINAGTALDPTEKQGRTRLLSNMLDEGAGELDSQAFQKELEDHSILMSFNANRDHFTGKLKTLSRHKDKAYALLKSALTEPRFDEEPLERMRDSNIARIKKSLSQPQWMAARLMNDIAYKGHPYALNSGGTLTTLKNITSEDLRTFLANNLTRDRLRIVAVGDITPGDLATLVDDIFGALPEKSTDAEIKNIFIQNSGDVILYEQDIPQTIIMMKQNGISRKDPDYHTAQLMNFTLGSSGFGSRLMEEIREKRGLTYGIYTNFETYQYAPSLDLSTSTKNESAVEMLSLIHQQYADMHRKGVTAKELATAKAFLIGALPLQMTSTSAIAVIMLNLRLDDLPIDYLDQRTEKINAATTEDVRRVAKTLLTPDKQTVILVGKPDNFRAKKIINHLPNVE